MSVLLIAAAGFAEMDTGVGDTLELTGLFATACLVGYIAYLMLDCFVKFLIGERRFSIRRILYITTLIAIAIGLGLKFGIALP